MEKELVETFEAAKKAADAVADGGGSLEVERCLDALRRLRKIPVNTKVLVDTQVGKQLRYLTKHSQKKIQAVASDLLKYWKSRVIEETDNKKLNTSGNKSSSKVDMKSEKSVNIKAEKISKAGSKGDIVGRSDSVKVEKETVDSERKAELSEGSMEMENGSSTVDQTTGGEVPKNRLVAPNGPTKLTSMVKCNNSVRDKLRDLLAEAFSRVSKETLGSKREEVRNIWDEVEACDPIHVAITVESAMFEKLGPSTGAHKIKYRSIIFNLKDSNNPDFRRRVLLGHVKPEEIANMTAGDMASDERRLSNEQIKEKALFECERGGAPKATTDQFKCGRCGQRKTTYYQLQTRSADEPMTTFVTCVNCNNHWKFC